MFVMRKKEFDYNFDNCHIMTQDNIVKCLYEFANKCLKVTPKLIEAISVKENNKQHHHCA